jgi:hypothetical protein
MFLTIKNLMHFFKNLIFKLDLIGFAKLSDNEFVFKEFFFQNIKLVCLADSRAAKIAPT